MEDISLSVEQVGQIWSDIKFEENEKGKQKSQNIVMQLKSSSKETLIEEEIKTDEVDEKEAVKKKKFQCKICNNVLSKKGHLDRHMKIHTGEKKFKCDFCGKGFIQPNEVRRHERVHIGQDYKTCNLCDKSYTSNYALNCHMRIHTGVGLSKCDLCEASFPENRLLRDHKRLLHEGDKILQEKHFTCDICNISFNSKVSFQIHKRRAHKSKAYKLEEHKLKDKPFKCDECDESFTICNTFLLHKFEKHGRKETKGENLLREEKAFVCNDCGASYDTKKALFKHKIVHKKKNITCQFCDELFRTSRELNHHMLKHQEDTNKQGSDVNADLNVDIETNTKTKNNIDLGDEGDSKNENDTRNSDDTGIKEVDQSFKENTESTQSDVSTRKSRNKGTKNQCNICNQHFKNRRQLSYHVFGHTGEIPLKCDVCDKIFLYDSDLQRHKNMKIRCKRLDIEIHVDGVVKEEVHNDIDNEMIVDTLTEPMNKVLDATINDDLDANMIDDVDANINEDFNATPTDDFHAFQDDDEEINHAIEQSLKDFIEENMTETKSTEIVDKKISANMDKQNTRDSKDESKAESSEDFFMVKRFYCNVCRKTFLFKIDLEIHQTVVSKCKVNKEDTSVNGDIEQVKDAATDMNVNSELSLDVDFKMEGEIKNPYKCNICDQYFYTIWSLEKHKITHTGEMPFQCEICNKGFLFKYMLTRHKNAVTKCVRKNSGEIPYQCDICNKGFLFRYKFLKHKNNLRKCVRKNSGEIPYQCDICNKGFLFRYQFLKHKNNLRKCVRKNSNDENTFEAFDSDDILRSDSSFNNESVVYIKNEQNDKEIQSSDKKIIEKQTLDSKQDLDEKKLKSIKCKICSLQFKTLRQQKEHMITHTGEVPFRCDDCDLDFLLKYDYENHLKTKRHLKCLRLKKRGKLNINAGWNQCEFCDISFKNNRQQKEHMIFHTDKVPFRCDDCNHNFLFKSDLEYHLKTKKHLKCLRLKKRGKLNINSGWNQCEFCDVSFKNNRQQKEHMITHTDKVPFRCDDCNHNFLFKSDLEHHLKTKKHQKCLRLKKRGKLDINAAWNQCEFCDISFKNSRHQKEHMITHTGVVPYRCDDCNHNFLFKSDYEKHLKTKKHL